MHQGSALSPLLFVIVMEALSTEFRVRRHNLGTTQNRLQWYGHVLQKEDSDWVNKCMEYEVEGARPRGRPKRIWREVVE